MLLGWVPNCTHCSTRIQCFEEKQHSEVLFLSEMKNTSYYWLKNDGGMLGNGFPVPGSLCRCAFCSGQGSCLCSCGPELCSGAETPSSFLLPGWCHSGLFSKAPLQIQALMDAAQSRQMFWRSFSLTSAFSSPMQLKVARAVGSSRGDLLKCGHSGRANTTTSRAATSTHTHSPTRPRCSRWGVLGEPRVPLWPLRSELEPWPLGIRVSRVWSTSLLQHAATGLHCSPWLLRWFGFLPHNSIFADVEWCFASLCTLYLGLSSFAENPWSIPKWSVFLILVLASDISSSIKYQCHSLWQFKQERSLILHRR